MLECVDRLTYSIMLSSVLMNGLYNLFAFCVSTIYKSYHFSIIANHHKHPVSSLFKMKTARYEYVVANVF